MVANDYETFMEQADAVFLGKLEASSMEGEYDQIATFTVTKVFKSELKSGEKVVVRNRLNSSCSRLIHPVGYVFYVFANSSQPGIYNMSDSATFVPMSVAEETNMRLQ